jgi:hypothetical protein
MQPAWAVATLTVVNNDGPGEGFNDPTPFISTGGNPATTLGDARLIAFQFAANLWGSMVNSLVEIRIEAQFDPLPCSPTQGVLGAAGANTVFRDFVNAPLANTWYPAALANGLAGFDLDPTSDDIGATFSSTVNGAPGCLGGLNWYYGLDGTPPANTLDFVTVVLHELAHGLGFQTFINLGTGAKLMGFNDTFLLHLEHHGAIPDLLEDMTNAQRQAAVIDDPDLHWIGPSVLAEAVAIPLTAGFPGGHVQMNAPNPIAPGSSVSHFSPALVPDQLMEPSYTTANHDLGLALQLMQDIGWPLAPQFGTDIVFLMDVTGSTGALMPNWLAQIPAIAQAWKNFDPNARFAVVSHADFPFAPHGAADEWAYRIESALDPSLAVLQTALSGLTQKWGMDEPESQYEAIYQVLTGAGRDLSGLHNFTDAGEIPITDLGRLYPMVLYHFTYPQIFHDRDTNPNYPFPGAKPVAGRSLVLTELAAQSASMMFFGLVTVSDLTASSPLVASSVDVSTSAASLSGPATISTGADRLVPVLPWDRPMRPVPLVKKGKLDEMAALTGGAVYVVQNDLSLLQDAIKTSIVRWAGSRQFTRRLVLPDWPIEPIGPLFPSRPVKPVVPIDPGHGGIVPRMK